MDSASIRKQCLENEIRVYLCCARKLVLHITDTAEFTRIKSWIERLVANTDDVEMRNHYMRRLLFHMQLTPKERAAEDKDGNIFRHPPPAILVAVLSPDVAKTDENYDDHTTKGPTEDGTTTISKTTGSDNSGETCSDHSQDTVKAVAQSTAGTRYLTSLDSNTSKETLHDGTSVRSLRGQETVNNRSDISVSNETITCLDSGSVSSGSPSTHMSVLEAFERIYTEKFKKILKAKARYNECRERKYKTDGTYIISRKRSKEKKEDVPEKESIPETETLIYSDALESIRLRGHTTRVHGDKTPHSSKHQLSSKTQTCLPRVFSDMPHKESLSKPEKKKRTTTSAAYMKPPQKYRSSCTKKKKKSPPQSKSFLSELHNLQSDIKSGDNNREHYEKKDVSDKTSPKTFKSRAEKLKYDLLNNGWDERISPIPEQSTITLFYREEYPATRKIPARSQRSDSSRLSHTILKSNKRTSKQTQPVRKGSSKDGDSAQAQSDSKYDMPQHEPKESMSQLIQKIDPEEGSFVKLSSSAHGKHNILPTTLNSESCSQRSHTARTSWSNRRMRGGTTPVKKSAGVPVLNEMYSRTVREYAPELFGVGGEVEWRDAAEVLEGIHDISCERPDPPRELARRMRCDGTERLDQESPEMPDFGSPIAFPEAPDWMIEQVQNENMERCTMGESPVSIGMRSYPSFDLQDAPAWLVDHVNDLNRTRINRSHEGSFLNRTMGSNEYDFLQQSPQSFSEAPDWIIQDVRQQQQNVFNRSISPGAQNLPSPMVPLQPGESPPMVQIRPLQGWPPTCALAENMVADDYIELMYPEYPDSLEITPNSFREAPSWIEEQVRLNFPLPNLASTPQDLGDISLPSFGGSPIGGQGSMSMSSPCTPEPFEYGSTMEAPQTFEYSSIGAVDEPSFAPSFGSSPISLPGRQQVRTPGSDTCERQPRRTQSPRQYSTPQSAQYVPPRDVPLNVRFTPPQSPRSPRQRSPPDLAFTPLQTPRRRGQRFNRYEVQGRKLDLFDYNFPQSAEKYENFGLPSPRRVESPRPYRPESPVPPFCTPPRSPRSPGSRMPRDNMVRRRIDFDQPPTPEMYTPGVTRTPRPIVTPPSVPRRRPQTFNELAAEELAADQFLDAQCLPPDLHSPVDLASPPEWMVRRVQSRQVEHYPPVGNLSRISEGTEPSCLSTPQRSPLSVGSDNDRRFDILNAPEWMVEQIQTNFGIPTVRPSPRPLTPESFDMMSEPSFVGPHGYDTSYGSAGLSPGQMQGRTPPYPTVRNRDDFDMTPPSFISSSGSPFLSPSQVQSGGTPTSPRPEDFEYESPGLIDYAGMRRQVEHRPPVGNLSRISERTEPSYSSEVPDYQELPSWMEDHFDELNRTRINRSHEFSFLDRPIGQEDTSFFVQSPQSFSEAPDWIVQDVRQQQQNVFNRSLSPGAQNLPSPMAPLQPGDFLPGIPMRPLQGWPPTCALAENMTADDYIELMYPEYPDSLEITPNSFREAPSWIQEHVRLNFPLPHLASTPQDLGDISLPSFGGSPIGGQGSMSMSSPCTPEPFEYGSTMEAPQTFEYSSIGAVDEPSFAPSFGSSPISLPGRQPVRTPGSDTCERQPRRTQSPRQYSTPQSAQYASPRDVPFNVRFTPPQSPRSPRQRSPPDLAFTPLQTPRRRGQRFNRYEVQGRKLDLFDYNFPQSAEKYENFGLPSPRRVESPRRYRPESPLPPFCTPPRSPRSPGSRMPRDNMVRRRIDFDQPPTPEMYTPGVTRTPRPIVTPPSVPRRRPQTFNELAAEELAADQFLDAQCLPPDLHSPVDLASPPEWMVRRVQSRQVEHYPPVGNLSRISEGTEPSCLSTPQRSPLSVGSDNDRRFDILNAPEWMVEQIQTNFGIPTVRPSPRPLTPESFDMMSEPSFVGPHGYDTSYGSAGLSPGQLQGRTPPYPTVRNQDYFDMTPPSFISSFDSPNISASTPNRIAPCDRRSPRQLTPGEQMIRYAGSPKTQGPCGTSPVRTPARSPRRTSPGRSRRQVLSPGSAGRSRTPTTTPPVRDSPSFRELPSWMKRHFDEINRTVMNRSHEQSFLNRSEEPSFLIDNSFADPPDFIIQDVRQQQQNVFNRSLSPGAQNLPSPMVPLQPGESPPMVQIRPLQGWPPPCALAENMTADDYIELMYPEYPDSLEITPNSFREAPSWIEEHVKLDFKMPGVSTPPGDILEQSLPSLIGSSVSGDRTRSPSRSPSAGRISGKISSSRTPVRVTTESLTRISQTGLNPPSPSQAPPMISASQKSQSLSPCTPEPFEYDSSMEAPQTFEYSSIGAVDEPSFAPSFGSSPISLPGRQPVRTPGSDTSDRQRRRATRPPKQYYPPISAQEFSSGNVSFSLRATPPHPTPPPRDPSPPDLAFTSLQTPRRRGQRLNRNEVQGRRLDLSDCNYPGSADKYENFGLPSPRRVESPRPYRPATPLPPLCTPTRSPRSHGARVPRENMRRRRIDFDALPVSPVSQPRASPQRTPQRSPRRSPGAAAANVAPDNWERLVSQHVPLEHWIELETSELVCSPGDFSFGEPPDWMIQETRNRNVVIPDAELVRPITPSPRPRSPPRFNDSLKSQRQSEPSRSRRISPAAPRRASTGEYRIPGRANTAFMGRPYQGGPVGYDILGNVSIPSDLSSFKEASMEDNFLSDMSLPYLIGSPSTPEPVVFPGYDPNYQPAVIAPAEQLLPHECDFRWMDRM